MPIPIVYFRVYILPKLCQVSLTEIKQRENVVKIF